MPDDVIPVELTLRDETGKEIDSVNANIPGRHEFNDLPPGKYTITCTPPEGIKVTPNPLSSGPLTGEKNTLIWESNVKNILYLVPPPTPPPTPPPPPEDPPPPLPALVVLTVASVTLFGNVALVDDFFLSRITPPWQAQPSPGSPRSPGNRGRRLSPQVEKRLRDCLQKNIESLLGVPSLTELVESLTEDEESLNTEFQVQVRTLYKRVQQLRKTITECDPSLIRELLEADRADEQEQNQNQIQPQCEATAIVIGELVNVRASPSLNSEVIGQVLYGTCVQVDIETFAYFSEQQRLAATTGEGWYPIVLPDGRRGYIYSRYVTPI